MKRCKVCEKRYQRGRIAFIMGATGGLKAARVCQDCAKDGVLLVAARAAVEKPVEKGPPASAEVLKNLKAQLKVLKTRAEHPDRKGADDFADGKVEGLENAIAALEGKKGHAA